MNERWQSEAGPGAARGKDVVSGGGLRERALYSRYYQEARRKLVAEERIRGLGLGLQLEARGYDTTYGEEHGKEGFIPAIEREVQANTGALAHPVYEDPALSLWYCRQRAGEAQHLPLRRVSPAHNPMAPFRRTSMFTTPTHLSLHDCPVEQPQHRARLAPVSLEYRPQEDRVARYPMAEVFTEVGKKYWCDR